MSLHNKYKLIIINIAILLSSLSACNQYLSIAPPINYISGGLVFNDEESAKAAITGIYSNMASGGYPNGNINSIGTITGMCADEFINYPAQYDEFHRNAILPTTSSPAWNLSYQYIYTANAIWEGVTKSTVLSDAVKTQLEGECKFIRAFCYFHLTNLFGDVPLNLNTDYQANSLSGRTAQTEIYHQIIKDLLDAQRLLGNDFYTTERVRPNKWTATALLARVYLYTKNYSEAEIHASRIIANTAMFSLKTDLNQVFIKNSTEAIWQLYPNTAGRNTNEGVLFLLTGTPANVSLTQNLIDAFDPSDKRRIQWIGNITVNNKTYYYPAKYKVGAVAALSEYSMVFRLAEQYLIRAEARINLDKIELGIGDLNTLRTRARLAPTIAVPNPLPALQLNLLKPDALLAVENERRFELFSESAHRWFDLNRTNRSEVILPLIKGASWQNTDKLFPIPQAERNNNPNVKQNNGY
ncbi:hypothetical protein HDC92_002230 [Pedobacter sp. AK017]|uniref:RagB/SusD family nutrient uptake outer membrane protein n=1 Tax=Pedobacter sp. AK017 TaxID=2723073 RepID=UPI0016152CEA|nr:RagB/SusD family nutrient uptake outer membrane protein [Pedobacter sp. AK017]MBB5438554.1 hypothetical protein [Pedobacter sp. AK017]